MKFSTLLALTTGLMAIDEAVKPPRPASPKKPRQWKISVEERKANASKAGKAAQRSSKVHKLTAEDQATAAAKGGAAIVAKSGGAGAFAKRLHEAKARKKEEREKELDKVMEESMLGTPAQQKADGAKYLLDRPSMPIEEGSRYDDEDPVRPCTYKCEYNCMCPSCVMTRIVCG